MSEGIGSSSNDDEPVVYRPGEEYSELGTFEVEEYIRKGDEIKASLERIVADIKASGSDLSEVDINISLLESIRLAIIPRSPIDVHHEDFERLEHTLEPTVIQRVSVSVLKDDLDRLGLKMVGRVVGVRDLRVELDPAAGHELLAFTQGSPRGVRREGGVRLTSGVTDGRRVLDFIIY